MSDGTVARLGTSALAGLPAQVARPAYDRERLGIGIVHIGPGAFHRAHQAWFTEVALSQPGAALDWGISAIALQRPDVPRALARQDGLYTLAVLDQAVRLQVVGAIREALYAPAARAQVNARLAAPSTRVVTLTITEKGYGFTQAGELDVTNAGIAADLADPLHPSSAVGLLALALRARHAAGVPPWLAISCDNLPRNSARLRTALLQFLGETAPAVRNWLAGEGRFVDTLVDSIAPAVTPALGAYVQDALGVHDEAPVHREPFTQWILADPGAVPRPAWDAAGALWVPDVTPYEQAKLRVLNGGHSTLAYLGLLSGLETMADAMATPLLASFATAMLREEVLPTLPRAPGFDHAQYLHSVLARIGNPRLGHRLAQIGMDGSQKLPVRLFPPIRERLAEGRPVARLCLAVGAWLCFVRRQARDGVALADPLDARLREVGRACTGVAEEDAPRFLAMRDVFPADLAADPRVRDGLVLACRALGDGSPAAVARALQASAPGNAGGTAAS